MASADALQRHVLDELAWQPELKAAAIGVSVESDGVVTLSGHVPSYLDRKLAEAAVKRIAGVKAVANELQVRLAGAATRNDTDIAEAAVAALQWNVAVPDEHIGVVVDHGVVTLEGTVDWRHQREAAEGAVRVLQGVKAVENRIAIAPAALRSDIARDIAAAVQRNAALAGQHIKVDVLDATVVLRGSVRTLEEREAVEEAAWRAAGVTEVQNLLDVLRPDETDELLARLDSGLER